MTVVRIPLERIQPNPWQTRLGEPDQEYIKDLAMDILANDLLQIPEGRLVDIDWEVLDLQDEGQLDACLAQGEHIFVQLSFGHNRKAAYEWLNDIKDNSNIPGDYSKIPINIHPLSNEEMAAHAWSENEQRRDTNPYERALAIRKRMDDFNWTQEQAAAELRLSRSAVSNILRLLKLPEEVQDQLREGSISERAALSLLPLYELPEVLIDHAESFWNEATKPSVIIKSAKNGQSSEIIRDRVDKLITSFSTNMDMAPWGLDDEMEHSLVESLTCRDCPVRLKDRNRCLNKDCFQLKDRIFQENYLYQAQEALEKKTGVFINIAEEDVDKFSSTTFTYESQPVIDMLRKSGCENLRLLYDTYNIENKPASLTDVGFPKAALICRRKNGHCTCLQGIDHMQKTGQAETQTWADEDEEGINDITWEFDEDTGDENIDDTIEADDEGLQEVTRSSPSADDLKEIMRQARKDKDAYRQVSERATKDAVDTLTCLLIDNDYHAWRLLSKYILGWKFKEDEAPEDQVDLVNLIAEHVINAETGYFDDREMPERLNKWLASKGLPEVEEPDAKDVSDGENKDEE